MRRGVAGFMDAYKTVFVAPVSCRQRGVARQREGVSANRENRTDFVTEKRKTDQRKEELSSIQPLSGQLANRPARLIKTGSLSTVKNSSSILVRILQCFSNARGYSMNAEGGSV